jgi:small-conductance mechanosensitive channel
VLFSASVPVLLVLSIPLVIGIGFASQDIIRNVLSGVVLAVDRDFQVGDVIRLGEHEGEVRSIGIRHVELLTSAGHVVDVPNVHFLTLPTSNITPDTSDAQVNINLALPSSAHVQKAKDLAYRAAAVTRFASPHRPPEVFVDVSLVDQSAELMIRGFVFDPAYEAHYRSDVVLMIQRELARVSDT